MGDDGGLGGLPLSPSWGHCWGVMENVYRYVGLEASLYDRLDELADFEDVDFYRWFAEAGDGPMLDVGCGTGRVLAPLVASGLEVEGVDVSPAMLAICRENLAKQGLEASLHEGDMRSFSVGEGRFGTVAIPGYSWQLLLQDDDVVQCFERCRDHLRPGGQLILPSYQPWDMIWEVENESPLEERKSIVDEELGERLTAWQGWKLDVRAQRIELRNVYERRTLDGALIEREDRTMQMRWDAPHDTLRLLGALGFSDVSLYDGYTFDPPESDSETVVFVARR